MTEDSIPATGKKKQYYYIYCPDMLKTNQRETKLFEFLQNKNIKGLKRIKNNVALEQLYDVMIDVTLQWLCSF